ncbi:MAG: hypothetical protein U5N26_08605 [Candidatus Marinimicrobia bacterium]|nr:hypothetical protein [Candidatus Neomarinimicrobiota bacterium]
MHAYEKAYKPLIGLLKEHPGIAVSLQYSGPLLEWLIENKPGFIDDIRLLTDRNNVELLSGAFYEPMLTLLPESDRIGQIKLQNSLLRDVFAYVPRECGYLNGYGPLTCLIAFARAGSNIR